MESITRLLLFLSVLGLVGISPYTNPAFAQTQILSQCCKSDGHAGRG